MILQLPGLPEFEARRLALEITSKLADEKLTGTPREIPALRVQVPASAKQNTSQLADMIVAEMMREMRREQG
jgi:hypothetical protein